MIEGITGTEEVSVKHRKDRKMQNQKVQEHLKALFDLSGFSNVQLELMQSLSLLGYVRIARETFLSYVPLAGAKEALDKLIRLGWVEHNKKQIRFLFIRSFWIWFIMIQSRLRKAVRRSQKK